MQLPVCRMFSVLASSDEEPQECIVCGRLGTEHELPGVRLLTSKDVAAERQAS
jgi:hypothetical protein